MSINRGMDEDVVKMYNGVFLSHKKKNNAIGNKLGGPKVVTLTEVSQTQKNKHHMISPICEILKGDIDELIYQTNTVTDTESKHTVTRDKEGERYPGGLGLTCTHYCV